MACDCRVHHAGENYDDAYGYTGSNLTTITRTFQSGEVYVKTLTYTGSQLDSISEWVLQ